MMFALLRRPSFLLVAVTSLGLAACSDPNTMTDSGFADVADGGARDTGNIGTDVVHPDVQGVDVPTTADAGACGMGYGPCNLVTNAGCGTGMACTFVDQGGTAMATCSPTGTVAPGGTCTTADACLQGFACLGNPGVCTKICCGPGDNDTCRTGVGGMHSASCSIPIQDVNFYACQATTNCDWFAQDCPSPTSNCQPLDGSGTTTCVAAGTGTDGATCGGGTGAVECARGFLCINSTSGDAGTGPTCRAMCDPTDTNGDGGVTDGGIPRTCPTGRHCGGVSFGSGGTIATFGVCTPG